MGQGFASPCDKVDAALLEGAVLPGVEVGAPAGRRVVRSHGDAEQVILAHPLPHVALLVVGLQKGLDEGGAHLRGHVRGGGH